MPTPVTTSESLGLASSNGLLRLRRSMRRAVVALFAALAIPAAGLAQEVVQPLPPQGVNDLNSALLRLASNSRDVDALIDAGNAALKLDDTDAAIGFYGRANELSPGNPRVKMGLASAYVRRESPLEALRLFDEAERAGVSSASLAGDRGLAYDLVGDGERAQMFYRQALSLAPNDEVQRRMALSQAIAGNRKGFEASLLPLLQRQDSAAFRIRSFGLAILGDDQQAIDIAEAVMPRALSLRIKPYLRYMDRLTPAQQAAAVHFGSFPQTAQIGRDDPRIADYTPPQRPAQVARADSKLTPQGQPLGPRKAPAVGKVPKPKIKRGRSTMSVTPTQPEAETPPAADGAALAAVVASQTYRMGELPAEPLTAPVQGVATQVAEAARPALAVVRPQSSAVMVDSVAQPTSLPMGATTEPSDSATAFAPLPAPGLAPEPAPAQIAQPLPAAPLPAEPASVADAFAGFSLTPGPVTAPSGAVDITAIKPPREVVKKPATEAPNPAKPAKATDPERIWVQIATGRDRSALRFDWGRFKRKAPELFKDRKGYLADWNQTSRLVTGPFDTARAANDFVAALGKQKIDSFPFTSAEGEKVDPLP